MNILKLIGRNEEIFIKDLKKNEYELLDAVKTSSFLVIGGAGSIGQAVVKEIFKRNPKLLHVVDISENNMVELVRDIRSTLGYIDGDFKTFAIDSGSKQFVSLTSIYNNYDYVLNLSALKHVRSEKDPFTLLRLIEVNILNTISSINISQKMNATKYFCVSTDKAANPVNMMGGSKRIMEMYLMQASQNINVSTARFANVAFSDGSLLHGFNQRFAKQQPIAAPNDVKRYFLTPQESGELCLMSCIFGNNRDIFFPKLSESLHLTTFSNIARKYIQELGYQPFECESEEYARVNATKLIKEKKWPCYFFKSDTSGEKDFEEFFTDNERLEMKRFKSIGVIQNELEFDENKLKYFKETVTKLIANRNIKKDEIIKLFNEMIPNFNHIETGKYLDDRM